MYYIAIHPVTVDKREALGMSVWQSKDEFLKDKEATEKMGIPRSRTQYFEIEYFDFLSR